MPRLTPAELVNSLSLSDIEIFLVIISVSVKWSLSCVISPSVQFVKPSLSKIFEPPFTLISVLLPTPSMFSLPWSSMYELKPYLESRLRKSPIVLTFVVSMFTV